jgi:hypothetical protein
LKEKKMPEYAIDFHATCRKEQDGSLTVNVQISGLPDVAMANKVSGWMRGIIQEHAHEIGRRETVHPQ